MSKIVFNKAQCKCNKGVNPLPLTPGSNIFSNAGIVLLETTKPIGMFGICQILSQASGSPTPCQPKYTVWKNLAENISVNGGKPLLENSTLGCRVGGEISLINVTSKVEVK